jgi:NAD(P)H dehydrogenase (quinone)
MTNTIAVTGVTGRLGGRVAARLAQQGVAQRLLARDPSRAGSLPNAEVAQASYADSDTVAQALSGVDTVFMVSAAEHPQRLLQHYAFVDGAVRAGVRQLVYTSFIGAAPDAVFTLGRDHGHTEAYIRESGLAFTFLRDNLYADFLPLLAGDDGVIRGPAGDGELAAVARDDIADVAAVVLRDPQPHRSATYDLTGPEDLSLRRAAEIISAATGRALRYQPETVEEAYASRAATGAPQWQLDAWVSTYTAIAAGELAGVTSAVPDLTGHPATTLAELARRRTP